MKLISFDVGIKNMAYCIFSISGEQMFSIDAWDVANLIDQETEPTPKCECAIVSTSKSKKNTTVPPKICGKAAKYSKDDKKYCEKHASQCSQYMLPKKEYNISSLRKMNVDQLRETSVKLEITIGNDKISKTQLLKTIQDYIEKKTFDIILHKKLKSANDMDLIQIGKNMKDYFDKIDGITDITHVAIENQISPIANRMKTIQGMLAQYFIMKNSNTVIEFVSSSHKLKQFATSSEENIHLTNHLTTASQTTPISTSSPIPSTQSIEYKKHKKDAIYYCYQLIENNPQFSSWINALNTKKKDDLADCFLQGVWYLRNKLSMTVITLKNI